MAKRTVPQGVCQFCQEVIAKTGATRHLAKCAGWQAAVAKAEAKADRAEQLIYLRVQPAYSSPFWLDLEMRGTASLRDLDEYLRAIWLDCCGHLSQFGDFGEDEWDMAEALATALPIGESLLHLYDFGTTSETTIKAVSVRTGKPLTKHPISLLFRNTLPSVQCSECGADATHYCEECRIEEDSPGWLCDKHAEKHPHENYGDPTPLVNSPRSGMCGYDGSAEPPY